MDKVIFTVEYDFNNVSATLLWSYISTQEGLSTWFADSVAINGKQYSFYWDSEERSATQISLKSEVSLKLRWNDEVSKKYFFEFKLTFNELTNNINLIITDFAKKEEIDDAINLWDEQIAVLRKRIGA